MISDSPAPRPVLAPSLPKEKGKNHASLTLDPTVADYDSDDSDEGSFERALYAINTMGREAGSTSGITPGSAPQPPSHTSPSQQPNGRHSLFLQHVMYDIAQWQQEGSVSADNPVLSRFHTANQMEGLPYTRQYP